MSDLTAGGCLMSEMQTKTDLQLLREYVGTGSETAFSELVSRHADLVYSAALRQVIEPDFARDVAQSVFADLARKARSLSGDVVLAGWLYRSTRFAALTFLRDERRRRNRERLAMQLLDPSGESSTDWDRICPVLDEAMANLGDVDRDALVLRFFKNEDLRSVGAALGTSEDAAQKRVARALEKLRAFLLRRRVTLSSAALATALTGSAVQAAPAALAGTISTAVIAGASAAAASSPFGLLNVMSLTKLKAGLLGAVVLAGAGTPIMVQQKSIARLRVENRELHEQSQQLQQPRSENQRLDGLRADGEELNRLRREVAELHRLRAEVAQLRRDKEESARIERENTGLKESLNALSSRESQIQSALNSKDREAAQYASYNRIVNNLRIIEGAKDQWALENKKGVGDPVTERDLLPYLKDNTMPSKVVGETYVVEAIGKAAYATTPVALGTIAAGGAITSD